MTASKKLTVSIIIPVYNEEDYIIPCLKAIAQQTVLPQEVIIVDNNSQDQTVSKVKEFIKSADSKGLNVELMSEKKQGALYARTKGFDFVKSEIIGRIDADTRVSKNWVEHLQQVFSDKKIDAVTGSTAMYDMPFPKNNWRFEHLVKNYLFHRQRGFPFLFGTNMAVRKSAWQSIKSELCDKKYIFEDADLAIHLYQNGFKLFYDTQLRAAMSGRRGADSFKQFVRYIKLQSVTYKDHGIKNIGSSISIAGYLLAYAFGRPLYQAYNSSTGKRSLFKLFRNPNQSRRHPFD